MALDQFGYRAARFADLKFGQSDAQRVELCAQMHSQAKEEAGAAEGQYTSHEHLHRLYDHERLTRRLVVEHAGLDIVLRVACIVDLESSRSTDDR